MSYFKRDWRSNPFEKHLNVVRTVTENGTPQVELEYRPGYEPEGLFGEQARIADAQLRVITETCPTEDCRATTEERTDHSVPGLAIGAVKKIVRPVCLEKPEGCRFP